MGRARLTRIDAVREMAAAVEVFRTEATAAIEGLDMDIRRALEWIHTDRRDHWRHEVRRGWDRITAARLQLQQARTARRVGDHEPACPDEKKALARAQKRLETAQEKVEAVSRCQRAIDEAVNDYRGARTPLAAWLESEAPKAVAALHRMMDQLEAYVAMQAPSAPSLDARSTQYAVPSIATPPMSAIEPASPQPSTEQRNVSSVPSIPPEGGTTSAPGGSA